MGVRAAQVLKDDPLGQKVLAFAIVTAVGQADVKAFSFKSGHPFMIVAVSCYTRLITAAVTVRVKISGVAVQAADIVPIAGAETAAVLAAAFNARMGSKNDTIEGNYTTDGTGLLTNGYLIIVYRPMPMNGDGFTE